MKILILLILALIALLALTKQPLFTKFKFKFAVPTKASDSILKNHVKYLSEINRTTKEGQEKVVNYILNELTNIGLAKNKLHIQTYTVNDRTYKNIIVSFKSHGKGLIPKNKYILGAHYDAFGELPGADDNASGVAGLLEAARILHEETIYNRNIDLVFYSTEEPPFFGTENMGSFHHAQSSMDTKTLKIKLAIVFDMIGYFSEEKNSQEYPVSFMKTMYPTKGNYISIVSNFSNLGITRKVKHRFRSFLRKNNLIEVQSINSSASIPGIDFSDHRNYWKFGFPAILITDTAFYRNKNYHTEKDTYEKLNYKKMKEVVDATVITLLSL